MKKLSAQSSIVVNVVISDILYHIGKNISTLRKEKINMTNKNLLRGRLGAMKMSLSTFAKLMGISRPTARRKIDGETLFNSKEIEKACEILEIPINEVPLYFFNT